MQSRRGGHHMAQGSASMSTAACAVREPRALLPVWVLRSVGRSSLQKRFIVECQLAVIVAQLGCYGPGAGSQVAVLFESGDSGGEDRGVAPSRDELLQQSIVDAQVRGHASVGLES